VQEVLALLVSIGQRKCSIV